MTLQYDIAIIGGGITGLGVARAAADAGKSVVLFEKDKICGATSSASLRIIHGGFRYLQQCDLPRIVDSVRAQIRLVAEYPEFIKPLQCCMPLGKSGLKSKYPVAAAALLYRTIYRMLSGRNETDRARVVSQRDAEKELPLLSGMCPHGALSWQDAYVVDLEGFVAKLVRELMEKGVHIQEDRRVHEIVRNQDYYLVKTSDGDFFARHTVNTTGAQIEDRDLGMNAPGGKIKWARGYNIIVKDKLLRDGAAVGIQSSAGRLFFLCPRGQGTALGTWYVPASDPTQSPVVSCAEIDSALQEINSIFPDLRLASADVEYAEAGLLPMSGLSQGEPQLIRKERVFVQDAQAIALSTKFTTYQLLGEKLLKSLSRT